MTLLDSPFRNKADYTPKQRASFYNPRTDEDSDSETDSDDDDFARDDSPDFHEGDNRIRARSRSSKGYIAPKRWPERLKESDSSGGSSGMGTAASNSTTSLIEIPPGSMGRQTSPELTSMNVIRGSMSDIGSEDLPLRKLSVSRETLDNRNLSPFVRSSGPHDGSNSSQKVYSASRKHSLKNQRLQRQICDERECSIAISETTLPIPRFIPLSTESPTNSIQTMKSSILNPGGPINPNTEPKKTPRDGNRHPVLTPWKPLIPLQEDKVFRRSRSPNPLRRDD
jgi:hypothetical protein